MAEQRLALRIDRMARGDHRLEFTFEKVQEALGTAIGWRLAVGQALTVLGVGRVVLGASLEVIQCFARIAHADHQYAVAQRGVGTGFQRLGLDRQRGKQGVAVEHVKHRIAAGWRCVLWLRDEDAVVAAGMRRMQDALFGLRQGHRLPVLGRGGGRQGCGQCGDGRHGEPLHGRASPAIGSGPSCQTTCRASSPEKRSR